MVLDERATGVTPHRIQWVGGLALVLYLFLIPFSKGAVETLFFLLLLIWLGGWKRPLTWENLRRIPPPTQRVLLFLGLYLGVCAASIFYSSSPELSLRGFIRKTLEYALLFAIAADLVDQPHIARRSVGALMAASWFVVLHGFLQEWAIYTAVYKPQAIDPILGFPLNYIRMTGPYENPNDLATFLMVVGLIAIAWVAERKTLRIASAHSVLVLLLTGCLIWTQSKGAILGLLGGLVLLAVIHWKRRSILWGLSGVAVVSIASFLFISWEHLRDILMLSDVASQDRMGMWKTAWAMIQARPLQGHGLNTFMANYGAYSPDNSHNPAYAHNCFLQMAAETGMIGLGAFLLFIGRAGSVMWKALEIPPKSLPPDASTLRTVLAGLVGAIAAFLIQSAFDTNFYALRQAALFWTFTGMAMGLATRLITLKQAFRVL